jgi:predicted transcriptional regulator
MARLTKEQWAEARSKWESDTRDGFAWLADELGISRPAVSKMASSQGWSKGNVTQVTRPEKVTPKLRKKVTQVTPDGSNSKPKVVPVITDAEWEEVDEKAERLHGNSKYDQRFDEQAYKLCLLGAIDEELADFFNVSVSTLNLWKQRHQSFSESLRRGKLVADTEVAESLFKRAVGCSHPDVHVSVIEGEVVLTELTKHYPPDTKAAFIWLKNRRSQNWRDKQEIELNNKVGPDMLKRLETDMIERMTKARERQRLVLIERGLVPVENDDE